MTSPALVSVLMPVFNARRYINDAIQSILSQTYENWELLICDDGSSDNSSEIIEKFSATDSRVYVLYHTVNLGYLKTCNELFKLAKGKFITWQDADDVSDLNRLSYQISFLQVNKNYAFVGTGARVISAEGKTIIDNKVVNYCYDEIQKGVKQHNQFCGASVMIKSTVLLEFGGYQNYFDRLGNEDYDLFARVSEKYPVANLSDALYTVRLAPGSISRSVKSPRQLISESIVKFLAEQRAANNGKDSLTGLGITQLKEKEDEWLKVYTHDPAAIFRKEADILAYNKMYKYAFAAAIKCFRQGPFRLINIKYLASCTLRYLSSLRK